jgi:hypothetical protein
MGVGPEAEPRRHAGGASTRSTWLGPHADEHADTVSSIGNDGAGRPVQTGPSSFLPFVRTYCHSGTYDTVFDDFAHTKDHVIETSSHGDFISDWHNVNNNY